MYSSMVLVRSLASARTARAFGLPSGRFAANQLALSSKVGAVSRAPLERLQAAAARRMRTRRSLPADVIGEPCAQFACGGPTSSTQRAQRSLTRKPQTPRARGIDRAVVVVTIVT